MTPSLNLNSSLVLLSAIFGASKTIAPPTLPAYGADSKQTSVSVLSGRHVDEPGRVGWSENGQLKMHDRPRDSGTSSASDSRTSAPVVLHTC